MYSKILRWVMTAAAFIGLAGLVITLNITAKRREKTAALRENLSYFKNFTLHGMDGETFTQEDLKGWRITVINGWAPWCGPCTGELPDLEKLNQEYRDKGLQVIGVVADYAQKKESEKADYQAEIRQALASTGVTYPVLLSDEAFTAEPYLLMNSAFPGTWAVDADGRLIDFVSGASDEEAWREYFDRWLTESGAETE